MDTSKIYLYIMFNTLNPSTMTSSNIINLGYAVVDFDNKSITWCFNSFTPKRDKAIKKAFNTFMIDSNYLRSL